MQTEKLNYPNEIVKNSTTCSTKLCFFSKLKSFLIYIIMWIIMNGFFVYLITLEELAYKYWFVAVPIVCFDILGILMIYTAVAKDANRLSNYSYVLTDKAIYFYDDGEHKQTKRIALDNVTHFERDKNNSHIFYVCTQNDFIKFEYVLDENNFYMQLAKSVNSK